MESFHLWRHYPEAPYFRFACTVVFDESAEDSYRVLDFDPQVADAGFLHQLADHLSRTAPAREADYEGTKIMERVEWYRPGTEEHFVNAIRQFPLAKVSERGRP